MHRFATSSSSSFLPAFSRASGWPRRPTIDPAVPREKGHCISCGWTSRHGCVQTGAAPYLHMLDFVAAMMRELNRQDPGHQWLGKTFDLASAYRQMAVSESSDWVSFIAVYNPSTGRPEVFQMHALPFGATMSVFSFLRVAHSLWFLGARCLGLVWSNYFDDFICMSQDSSSSITSGCVRAFVDLLGWKVSGREKDLPFDRIFKALGVQMSLDNWRGGTVFMQNTEKRILELNECIDKALSTGVLTCASVLALRGRMQFANSQVWGRASKVCLKQVMLHLQQPYLPSNECSTQANPRRSHPA